MGGPLAESQQVALAKQRLRNTSNQQASDFLDPVRENPIASVGAAFAAGLLCRKMLSGKISGSLLSIGLQQVLKRL